MKHLLFLLFFPLSLSLNAQSQEKVWFAAEVTLLDGTLLKGEANYNMRHQTIQVKANDKTYSFDEREIAEMIMSQGEFRHQFMLVAFKDNTGYVQVMLGELLYKSENHVSFFLRHGAFTKESFWHMGAVMDYTKEKAANLEKDSFQPGKGMFSRRFDFGFLADYDGHLYMANRKGLLEAYKSHSKKIKKYAGRNGFNFRKEEDIISILKYAESLAEGTAGNGG